MKFESEDIVFTPITELLSKVIDNRGRSCPTADKGIPLIATNCIGNENLYPVKKNIRHVSLETYNSWFRGHPEPGDVIFVNKGTPGRVCLVPDPIDFCIAQDMVSLRVNERINNLYLLAAIRSPQVQNQIQQMQVGTMIPHFKKGDFGKLLIPIRNMPTQKAIGKIYFELSQKIDVNERTSRTLEDIAQTIFKSWFIDFDPVKAKMAGETPAGMDAATAALFPDSMEESELGLIPRGWEVRNIGSLCETLLGGTPSRKRNDFWGGAIPWINSGKVNDFRVCTPSEFITELGLQKSATKLLPKGTTVLAITGATLGQFSRLEFDACANQSVVGILGSANASNEFVFLSIKNGIQRLISAQTGGAQQHINKEDVNAFPIVYPGKALMVAFTNSVEDMFSEIGVLLNQSNSLTEIRDALLPRLISGELQIPEEMLAS